MPDSGLLEAFEVHSPESIQKALTDGVSPVDLIQGKRPIDHLIATYLRSPRFADCLRVMLSAGASISDPLLEAVLLDDSSKLLRLVTDNPQCVHRKLDMLGAFTSCRGVTALHICAEFNSVRCARVLLENGADVNAAADCDLVGMGAQTPIFHAVNGILNYCRPVMELLVEAGANLRAQVKSLLWGEAMSWETVLYDVTPVSYAQCGLYRQFHRREEDVYSNLQYLYRRMYGTEPEIRNVPNRYLVGR
ncbi:MAG: ankyrin repeat domain-containing protein [Acidobacteriota bacterium]|nr:ankyrin repeat domain-containing protein [Acidobacteriota bacterium]